MWRRWAWPTKNAGLMWALLARGDSYRVRPTIRDLMGENQELNYLPKVRPSRNF
jgi:hypothetical protein